MNWNRLESMISHADFEDLNVIQEILRKRHNELCPDWDLVYLIIPREDPQERKLFLETAVEQWMMDLP